MVYEEELSKKLIGCAIEVHSRLGNGFLEKVYENSLLVELRRNNIVVENQVEIDVRYKGQIVGKYFTDIVVNNKIIVELKVVTKITDIHKAQLINYLKATGIKVGYIINFGSYDKLEFKRYIY